MKTNANRFDSDGSVGRQSSRRWPLPILALALANVACDDYTPPADDDLNAWCPSDPTVRWCPSGTCNEEYQCVSYCIRHHPSGDNTPERGLGAWCDDERMPEFGTFCSEHSDVNGCDLWCDENPNSCTSSADGDADGDTDADSDGDVETLCGDGECRGTENAETCPDDCPTTCGDGVVTGDEICETPESTPCTDDCGSDGTRACIDCDWPETCTPPDEICNGSDDDCDGDCDNGFECCVGEETTCTTTCDTQGTTVCQADVCTWALYCTPPEEVCDGIDNDCDEDVDEGCDCAEGWVEEDLPGEVPIDEYLLTGIWGSAWNDVFIIGGIFDGSSAIFHFDGETWSIVHEPSQRPNAIGGSSSDDVVVVGPDGMILSYDGTQWEEAPSPTTINLNGVWGDDSGEYFAVGTLGTIVHFDGDHWTEMDSPTEMPLNDLWGASSDEIYAVGDEALLLYGGFTWSELDSAVGINFFDVHGYSASRVVFTGYNYSDSSGVFLHEADELILFHEFGAVGVFVFSEARIVAVGNESGDRVIEIFDGSGWTPEAALDGGSFLDVWASSPTNIYVTGATRDPGAPTLLHRCGSGW